ncbi:hypothetical protein PR001_g21765 [Phytophthora rubi]|uniref:Uncharacterized protein n=1 Tax=Phytophthora rubi TaxID=129364 RepID=A0A6A3J6U9_9STRA|nr:hypothetical protein PR001_g21765 [Phytophthora rubi]
MESLKALGSTSSAGFVTSVRVGATDSCMARGGRFMGMRLGDSRLLSESTLDWYRGKGEGVVVEVWAGPAEGLGASWPVAGLVAACLTDPARIVKGSCTTRIARNQDLRSQSHSLSISKAPNTNPGSRNIGKRVGAAWATLVRLSKSGATKGPVKLLISMGLRKTKIGSCSNRRKSSVRATTYRTFSAVYWRPVSLPRGLDNDSSAESGARSFFFFFLDDLRFVAALAVGCCWSSAFAGFRPVRPRLASRPFAAPSSGAVSGTANCSS